MEIVEIGSKPGEKLYEELMSDEETRRTIELDKFFSVMPAFKGLYGDIKYNYSKIVSEIVKDPYVSEKRVFLTVEEVKQFLSDGNLLYRSGDNAENIKYYSGNKENKL